MNRRRLPLLLLALIPLLSTPAPARADESSAPREDLSGAYELRGFYGTGDKVVVSIRINRSGNSYWIRVGDRLGNLTVERADLEEGTAVIVVGGVRKTLRLAKEQSVETRSHA